MSQNRTTAVSKRSHYTLMHRISKQNIKNLLTKVSDIVESPENKKKAKIHKENLFQGIPFYVSVESSMWGGILGFDMREIYQDVKTCLMFELKRVIYHFKNFKDDTSFHKTISSYLGSPILEPSLFGVEIIFSPDHNAWIGKKPIINTIRDLDSFKYPSFYKSGLMPHIHQFYKKTRASVSDDWNVSFPQWGRGSFGIACDLRGMSNLLIDMFDNPKFVHKLMRFVTNAHIMWCEERAKFLGTKIEPFVIFNDEVNCPSLSPELYREFVLPYDQEICNFYGKIHWHSCGNVTPLLYLLKEIGEIYSFHVSAWTDLSSAVKVFGGDVPLNVFLHPLKEIYMSTDIEKRARLKEIMKVCGNIPYSIVAGELLTRGRDVEEDIKAIKKWIKIVRELTKTKHFML